MSFLARSETERPIMDIYHSQIIITQQRMASLWTIYAEERQKADRNIQAVVAGLNILIHAPGFENTDAPSFLTPI